MQKLLKDAKIALLATVISTATSCVSLLFIPFAVLLAKDVQKPMAFVIATVFWLGLAVAFAATLATRKTLGEHLQTLVEKGEIKEQKLPGVAMFSLKAKNIIIYSVVAVGLVFIITDIIFHYVPEMIMFPILSLTVMAFVLHCIIDGKYYKVYKHIKESVKDETNH